MRVLVRTSTALCNLSLYSNYLLVNPRNKGCTQLAFGMETMSHDSVRNFLVCEDYTPQDLFERVCLLIVLVGGTLSVDDSVWDKPYSNAKLNPLVARQYSGKHHCVVKGICLVTLFYTDINGVGLPVNYRVYEPISGVTKNELFLEMLKEVLDWGLAPALVTGDSWYSSKENLRFIRSHKMDAFFGVEKTRTVSTQKGVYQKVADIVIDENGVLTHLKNFDFVTLFRKEQAGKVRHYVYYKYYNLKEKEKPQKATKEDFEKSHSLHWHIEEFHRAKKQLCNAKNFLVRTKKAVQNHIFSVYWAFVTLEEYVINKICTNWYQFKNKITYQTIKTNLM